MKRNILNLIAIVLLLPFTFVACGGGEENNNIGEGIQMSINATNSFTLRLAVEGTGKISIKWGDGSPIETYSLRSDSILSYKHTYDKASTYSITVAGELIYFNCKSGNVTFLDVSKDNVLSKLDCSNNLLTTLDISKNTGIFYLNCEGNRLSKLDLSKNNLAYLFCGGNNFTHIDLNNNTLLTQLDCSLNQLTNLDVSTNIRLTDLKCSGNHLSNLQLENNYALAVLHCNGNNISNLDLSANYRLVDIDCSLNNSENGLSHLDLSGKLLLKYVRCSSNLFFPQDLNALFETLHDRANEKEYYIDISKNPGTKGCNTIIAKLKGWNVITE